MPRIIDNFDLEPEYAFETIQSIGKMTILINAIQEETSSHTEKYPNHGNIKDILLGIAMISDVNRITGIEIYHKGPAFGIISDFGSREVVYG